MKKIIVSEKQKALLFKNGKYVKLLGAGKHIVFGNAEFEKFMADSEVISRFCTAEALLADKEFAEAASLCKVGDNEIALHFVDGRFVGTLRGGNHIFLKMAGEHEFRIYDMSETEIPSEIPEYLLYKMNSSDCSEVNVPTFHKGLLFVDGKFRKVLDSGTYYFWNNGTKIETKLCDMRTTKLDITGQEMLTQDKVTIRVNFTCNYRITDFVRVYSETDDFCEQMYFRAQLAIREYVGRYKLDEILSQREEMSAYILSRLHECEKELYVEISDGGVKDIILPGEIRDIMNTVLVAEKRAQASVITRREEVASTRSLLNTAKLMEENKTLYRLKEMEYIERICENVGNINLGAKDLGSLISTLAGQETN